MQEIKLIKDFCQLFKKESTLYVKTWQKILPGMEKGSNCLLEVLVKGAKNTDDAIMLAKSICNSALVKTAIHGCDPNWGRIISAAGNSGVKFI